MAKTTSPSAKLLFSKFDTVSTLVSAICKGFIYVEMFKTKLVIGWCSWGRFICLIVKKIFSNIGFKCGTSYIVNILYYSTSVVWALINGPSSSFTKNEGHNCPNNTILPVSVFYGISHRRLFNFHHILTEP